jgi:uncharacterized protein YcnI
MTPPRPRRPRRAAAACPALPAALLFVFLSAAAAILLTAAPAAAHVLLAKAQPNGDGTTTLTFTFDHGCGKAPTTELTVSLPGGITTVTTPATSPATPSAAGAATTQPARWTGRVTAKRVSWTGPGITPGNQAAFSVRTRIIGTVGQTFHFPTIQRCDNGEFYEWAGHQPTDEHPAPTMIATRAVLASQPPPPATPVVTSDETGASLPQALAAVAAFTMAVTALGIFLTRGGAPGATSETVEPARAAIGSDQPARH